MDIFERVKALNFPKDQFVVVGSGPLEALGLREAHDLDIAVLPELFEKLRSSGEYKERAEYGKIFLDKEGVTIIPSVEWEKFPVTTPEAISEAMIIHDINFLNLRHLRMFKTAMNRKNDLADIALIDEYEKRSSQHDLKV